MAALLRPMRWMPAALRGKRSLSTSVIKGLSKADQEFLHENGYLVVKGFTSQKKCEALKQQLNKLIDDFDPSSSTSVFSTHESKRDYQDTYFLESGDKVRFFWEEDAFAEDGTTLQYPKRECINKVGHALHIKDQIFRDYCSSLAQVASDIGMQKPIPLQSMYICKSPRTGGEVGPHQDSTFLYTDPPSVHGLWLSIDSAGLDNGCLWVVPGSQDTPIQKRFVRTNETDTTGLKMIDNERTVEELSTKGGVALPTESGDLVILHGQVVHWSEKNTSGLSRHALMLHVVDGASEYSSENWLQHEGGIKEFPSFEDLK